jgi:hypothetical protein
MIEYVREIGLHIWHCVLCEVGGGFEEEVQDLNVTVEHI